MLGNDLGMRCSQNFFLTLNGCLFRNVSLLRCQLTCKYSKNILNVFGNHLIFMNMLFRKEEGYIVYLLKVGEKLCLFVCVRSLSILKKRCKKLLFLRLVIHVCLSSYNFYLVFYDEYWIGWETFPKCLGLNLIYASSYASYFGKISLLKCYLIQAS